ncbi:hypothetical protein [Micromonospora lutea]|uniref:Uncharacterized protein n=1 Tax=Micromonospora lutea TaxID=419825 RepID=A0ABQ4J1W1_9ACTN|nr:hypothetical protein [Micromonospora lutea]GIJ24177.1 hypothetical protein Vlu01_48010 [Micromonospora lutea]
MAVAIGVTGTTQAAPAAPASAQTAAGTAAVAPQLFTINWASLIVNLASTYLNNGSEVALQAAVNQIIAAVESAKTEILNHIDAIASADVQACARQHTIEFADINRMSPSVLELWAQNATSCATRATSYFHAVQSLSAADRIGFIVPEIYAIAIAARATAGFSISLLKEDLIRTTEAIIVKLKPDCRDVPLIWWEPSEGTWYMENHYHCTAYNGRKASQYEAWMGTVLLTDPLDRAWVEAEASKDTSRPFAIAALPQLRTIPA